MTKPTFPIRLRNARCVRIAVLSTIVFVAFAVQQASAQPASSSDFEIPWNEDTDDPTLISMGPIGARAKTDHLLVGSPESRSNSAVIKYIFKNSPAEGKLQLEDVVTGVNGASFDNDFSRRMGAAIDASGNKTGKLSLKILRKGNPLTVNFAIPKTGSFGDAFPYNCKKSDAILEAACDWLAAHQWPNGKLEPNPNTGGCVCTAVTGLAMLGSGNQKYAKNIELIVDYFFNYFTTRRTADGHFGPISLEGWQLMYGSMFLSEYYLATGDRRVPEHLAYLNKEIDRLQFRNLDADTVAALNANFPNDGVPPYWFGHGYITRGHIGYAHLGVNTANALVAWNLIARCGVTIDRNNYARTMDYIQTVCPSGEMAYAGRPNQRGGDSDSFGRTGVLAVAYALGNDRPEMAQRIAGALQRHSGPDYYTSHSSAVMGKVWGSLGIAALDPKLFRQVMDDHKYDYDLIRLHDGRFVSNPAHWNQVGHSQADLKGAYGHGHRWTTAFNALLFAVGKQRLQILGGGHNIPGVDSANLKGELRRAFTLIKARQYDRAIEALTKFVETPRLANERETAETMLKYVANFTQSAKTPPQEQQANELEIKPGKMLPAPGTKSKSDIDKIAQTYADACELADKNLRKAFDKQIELVRKFPKLKADEKQIQIENLKIEQATFEKYGTIPFSPTMRNDAIKYLKALAQAVVPVSKVYDEAISKLTNAKDDSAAKEKRVEKDKVLAPKKVGKWSLPMPANPDIKWEFTLYSNGTFAKNGDFDKPPHTWILDRNGMVAKSPDHAGGEWVYRFVFDESGQTSSLQEKFKAVRID